MRKQFSALAIIFFQFASFATPDEFWFAQITDTHFGRTLHHQRFTNAIERINNLPFNLDVVAHTGDFASDNMERNIVAITNLFATITAAPLIVVPGNHDISNRGADPKKRITDCLEVYQKHIGELGTVTETENAFYITVCTEGLYPEFADIGEITGFDPVTFTREALAKNTAGKPAFVFTHRPDGDDFYNDTHHPARMTRRDEWRKTLADGGATALIAGHFHREEYQNDAYGVPVYVCGPIANYWGRQGSFRVFYFRDNKLSYHTVYIEDPREETRD